MISLRFMLLLALVVLPGKCLFAQEHAAYSFLRLETNARVAAMGGAGEAGTVEDAAQLFVNPSLLSSGAHRNASLTYLNLPGQVNAGALVTARQVKRVGTVGVGLRYLNWGDAESADEAGNATGDLNAAELDLSVGVSRTRGAAFTYGVTAHYLYTGIEAFTGSALAADAGVSYRIPSANAVFSASLRGVGVVVNDLGDTPDELPVELRIGASKRLAHLPLLVSVTAYDLTDLKSAPRGLALPSRLFHFLRIGGEFQLSESFQVRLGYDHRQHTALKSHSRLDTAGLSLGFGILLRRVRIDYAFRSWSASGNMHYFTVGSRI